MRYKPSYKLLTFYKFVDISDPEQITLEHAEFCNDLGLKWRVYIGTEGISSTVSWTPWQCWAYQQYLEQIEYFKGIEDIDTKSVIVDEHQFTKMIVKHRDEIVSLWKTYKAQEINDWWQRMSVEEFKEIIDSANPDYVILDMRNNYEWKLGHFKWALPAGTINFRDLEEYCDIYKKKFAGKKIITYCTWGIRCEKATVLMREFGLDSCYQLDWGVMKYVNTYDDWNRLGNLYTFDWRVSMMIGSSKHHTTIGTCNYSDKPSDNCENCRYSPCNARIIAQRKEYKKHFGFCSEECCEKARQDLLIKEESFDPMNYKWLRALIKEWQVSLSDAQAKVSQHIDHRLRKTEFNHKTNQKEDIVDQNLFHDIVSELS